MAAFPAWPFVDRLIDLALEEDLGAGDVTTQALIPPDLQGEAHLRARQELVVAGLPAAGRVFGKLDASLAFEPQVAEGREIAAGTVLARLPRPGGRNPYGRAHRPQLPAAPLGHRHLHPADGELD